MRTIFWNPDERRLRTGWRISLFAVLLFLFSLGGQLAVRAAAGGIPKDPFLRNAAVILLAALAATIAVPLARRRFDRKSFASLGLAGGPRRATTDLLFGFALSGLMAGSIFAAMALTGLIELHGVQWSPLQPAAALASPAVAVGIASLLALLLLDVVVGWWEELVFRGYLLQNLAEGLGLAPAVILSCVLYGLVHSLNPNAGILSSAIIVLFGFLRIYGYLATGLLWLSIGMHIGWNFFQGPIFGYAASGHETARLIAHAPSGPGWLSGGAFGPEGSVLTIPAVLLALLVMRWWAGVNRPSETESSRELGERITDPAASGLAGRPGTGP